MSTSNIQHSTPNAQVRTARPWTLVVGRWLLGVGVVLSCGEGLAQGTKQPMTADFNFRTWSYGGHFPPGGLSFIVFDNPAKTRPLFIAGAGRMKSLIFTFDTDGGLLTRPMVRPSGSAELEYKNYNGTLAADVDNYTCSAWFKAKPRPKVKVTIKSVVGWKEKTEQMVKVMAWREPGARERVPPRPVATYTAVVDLDLSVGTRKVSIAKRPCTVIFNTVDTQKRRYQPGWQMELTTELKVRGAALGLAGADAGELDVTVVAGAYAKQPQVKTLSKVVKAADELDDAAATEDEIDGIEVPGKKKKSVAEDDIDFDL